MDVAANPSNLKISPSKMRRHKGEGNGYIYWRKITKNGKDYRQAYYHWQEKGRKRTKYIPKHLLGDIQQAEAAKRPVKEILLILGISVDPSNLSEDTGNSPSKMRRHKGEGSGNIYWRVITKNGKDYPQAYYHFEIWTQGDRLIKSSKYIPKRLLQRVQNLEEQKTPVREILQVLGLSI